MKKIFVPCFSTVKLKRSLMKTALDKVKPYERVGLVATVQFIPHLAELENYLKDNKKTVERAYGKRTQFKSQILGCDVSAAQKLDVDCYLYLGTGNFHPVLVAAKTGKPTFIINPISEKISPVDTKDANRLITKITVKREQVLDAQRIGILVSTKPGQERMKRALHLKKELEAKGKEVFVFVSNEIVPESLLDFPDIEAWVNTACYRIIDESERFEGPVVDLEDL
jgi:2-(3-amino-3-carboxypropyl)histidine synthase